MKRVDVERLGAPGGPEDAELRKIDLVAPVSGSNALQKLQPAHTNHGRQTVNPGFTRPERLQAVARRRGQRERSASMYARSNVFTLVCQPFPVDLSHSSTSASILNVTCCLRRTGSKPRLTTARANISTVASGWSLRSMSSSFSASIRFQSEETFEGFEVDFALTSCGSSQRDDTYTVNR